MSGRAASGGGRTKGGKPRPGTGGYGKRKLEGKGPTPPAEQRPGHPAQRRAAAQAKRSGTGQAGAGRDRYGTTSERSAGGRSDPVRSGPARSGAGRAAVGRSGTGRATSATGGRGPARASGGTAAELVAGRNAVLEALRAEVPATALHVGPRLDNDERIGLAVMLAADANIPVVEAGRAELDRLTGGAVHQGLALRIRRYSYADPADLVQAAREAGQQPLIVALDGVTDPRNLGAVARSVAAFSGHGILVPGRRSAGVTAGAWKASAGALARVRVAQTANLVRALASYQEDGLFVAGLAGDGSADIVDLDLADSPLVLVVGSEGKGLSRLVTERCDVTARVPITGPAESLNAGIAASIALYAVSRLRGAAS
ncbi:MAG TPA: 23S rRNA (guanosine(2251)-2'-O)-methyltransferase RlmB [Streptosporangiaceae bacterium]